MLRGLLGIQYKVSSVSLHCPGEHLPLRHALQGSFHLWDRSTNIVFWFDSIITCFMSTCCASSVPFFEFLHEVLLLLSKNRVERAAMALGFYPVERPTTVRKGAAGLWP